MICYFDGDFVEDVVSLDASNPGLLYGFGLFETLLYNGSVICHLDRHLVRIRASMEYFGMGTNTPDCESIVSELLSVNRLKTKQARVNINVIGGIDGSISMWILRVQEYTRVENQSQKLFIFDQHHQSHLCRHKTTNYMHCHFARSEAIRNGFDDALLLEADGAVIESSTSSLLFRKDDSCFEPESAYKLPGIALDVVKEMMEIGPERINRNDLDKFDSVYALNSLRGAVPVARIDNHAFKKDSETCKEISEPIINP